MLYSRNFTMSPWNISNASNNIALSFLTLLNVGTSFKTKIIFLYQYMYLYVRTSYEIRSPLHVSELILVLLICNFLVPSYNYNIWGLSWKEVCCWGAMRKLCNTLFIDLRWNPVEQLLSFRWFYLHVPFTHKHYGHVSIISHLPCLNVAWWYMRWTVSQFLHFIDCIFSSFYQKLIWLLFAIS